MIQFVSKLKLPGTYNVLQYKSAVILFLKKYTVHVGQDLTTSHNFEKFATIYQFKIRDIHCTICIDQQKLHVINSHKILHELRSCRMYHLARLEEATKL